MEAQGEQGASSRSHGYFMVEPGSKTRTNPAIHRMGALFIGCAEMKVETTQKWEYPSVSQGLGLSLNLDIDNRDKARYTVNTRTDFGPCLGHRQTPWTNLWAALQNVIEMAETNIWAILQPNLSVVWSVTCLPKRKNIADFNLGNRGFQTLLL